MKPVDLAQAEGHENVRVTNNKRGYVLVQCSHRWRNLLGSHAREWGIIYKQNHLGWEKTQYEGKHSVMVTCFYNLTKN